MSDRIDLMKAWLDGLGYEKYDLTVASEDASFRSYWRLMQGDESWVVMDAPPHKEPCDDFVKVAKKLRVMGLNAPEIIHENHEQGFLLLTDFGNTSYLQALNEQSASSLYADAASAILQMQTAINADDLPLYDETLLRTEMNLFKEWFLERYLGLELKPQQLDLWQMTTETLVKNALEQPQVFVHRDYHSRNLMKLDENNPGMLDFQDAVKGPVTYDLVSLLRDCYIDWPKPQVNQWMLNFYDSAVVEQLQGISAKVFTHWFNLMGVQRHLKAIGIFSRLKLRDGKDHYLKEIPRTLDYITTAVSSEVSLAGLYTLISELNLDSRVKPLTR